MSDGALRGTSEDPDAAISNQPEVSVPIELALQPPSEGTGSVVSGMRTGPGPHTLMTAGHVVYIKNSGVPVCPRSRSSSRAWSAVLPASKWRRPACSSPEASRGVGRRAPHRCGSRRHSGHRPWKHRGMVRLRRLAGRGPAVCRCQHLRLSRYEVACVAEGYAPSSMTLEVTDDRDLRVEVRLTANGPGR
jgi:hypothetical protein